MEDIMVVLILGICGVLFLYLGYMIWIKGKIELIHDYHYTKVKEENKKAYTGLMGKAVVSIGVGQIVSAIIYIFTQSGCCMIAFGVGFGVALIMMTYAQIKYNHGII